MSGIEKILDLIDCQQKENEKSLISSAKKKAERISDEGRESAEKAYKEKIRISSEHLRQDYENKCSSIDARMKRKILYTKIECIEDVRKKALEKMRSLPDKEYFSLLEKLAAKTIKNGKKGKIYLGKNDLKRNYSDFENNLGIIADQKNGTVELSKIPADIQDGFIIEYGLISENCSFEAIMESEKDNIKDTAAKILFG